MNDFGPQERKVFRPAERIVSGIVYAGIAASAVVNAFRPSTGVVERSILIAAAFVVGVSGLLVTRQRLVIDDAGLRDVSGWRSVFVPWAAVIAVDVGRIGGLLDGYCIRLRLTDGSDFDLRGTRSYYRIPSSKALFRLQELAADLRVRQQRERDRSQR